MKAFEKTGKDFSFVVFDPPTFSRNKRSTFSVKNNYSNSLQLIDNIVRDGYIFTSANSPGVSKKEYISYHPGNWELIIFGNESKDFKFADVPYLKAGIWKKN